MTPDQRFSLLVVLITAVFVPMIVVLYRGIVKWTRTEDKLDQLIKDVEKLVKDKDETHDAMLKTMVNDRAATDRRLRWLEENLWKGRGRTNAL